MNQFKKTTLRLTLTYSFIFFCFIWAFSGGLYVWTNNSLGSGYVNRINEIIEQSGNPNRSPVELSDNTAMIAADVALDRLRNIILLVNGLAVVAVPTLAFYLSRRSLQPLIRSQAEQQQFISNASHELRTPLAVMSGELELAIRKDRTAKEYVATIKNTKKEVGRMTKLVQELLLMTRVENDPALRHFSLIDLRQLVCEISDLYKINAKQKNITINIQSIADATIMGRKDLFVIALGNLIDNAIKFSNPNKIINVAIKRDKNNIVIGINNQGPTIPSKKLSRLFDRFYQSNIDHATDGFGLGLAITKRIVELHHGGIDVESRNNETTFRLTIPSTKKKSDR